MDMLKNLGGTLKDASGNIAKAYLCVRDAAGMQSDAGDNLSNFKEDSAAVQKAILKAAANKIKQVDKDANERTGKEAEEILKSGVRGSGNSSKGLSFDELADLMKGKYVPVQVQYNPSSIRMTSDPGGRRRINPTEGVGAGGDGQSIKDLPKNTELHCTLVFEKINVNDAFIQASEGWNASLGNITSTAGSAVKKISGIAGDEPYSVRKQVEGFVALLSTTYTRDVIFYYGKMCFHGEITSANATYKMFNKNGDPIYAEVAIKIRQSNENPYDQERWRVSYDALFKEDESDIAKSGWDKVKGVGSKISDAFSGGIF